MKTFLILVIVTICILTAWSWIDYAGAGDAEFSRTYSGRLYLEGNEYNEFKKYLAEHPEVEIVKLEALSSPNAMVDFEFSVPVNYDFPYGEVSIIYEKDMDMSRSGLVSGFAVIFMGVCMVGLAYCKEVKE